MKGYLTFGNEWIVRNLWHFQSRNEWIVRNLGHLQSRNEWIVRKSGHRPDGAFLAVNYYGFCRFWPKTSKNLMVFKVFTWKCANWLGGVAKFDARNPSSRNESIVRKWPGKIKFLVRVFRFPRKWPVGTSILLESGIVLEFQTAKTLESGIVWRKNAWEWYRFWTWGINLA